MQYNFTSFKDDTKKIQERLSTELSRLHTGRAAVALIDGVEIESFGARMPIKNVASISIEDPKTLRVAPWDKGQIKDIERAIAAANLGLSTASDDMGVRVICPSLTTETRIALVKTAKERLEEGRIAVRVARDKVHTDIDKKEKNGEMSEDDKFRARDGLQKLVDEANQNLESSFERKEKDIMS